MMPCVRPGRTSPLSTMTLRWASFSRGDGRTSPDHFDPELLAIFRAHADEFAREYAADPDSGEEALEKHRLVHGSDIETDKPTG